MCAGGRQEWKQMKTTCNLCSSLPRTPLRNVCGSINYGRGWVQFYCIIPGHTTTSASSPSSKMSPMSHRRVLLIVAVLLLASSSAASPATNATRAPHVIYEQFTVPADYRNVHADIPPICTHGVSSSCGSVSGGITACGVYTPSTRSCRKFCIGVIRRFPLFKRRCRRRRRGSRWHVYRAYRRCRSECARASFAIRRTGTRPHALVRVTYRNGRVSGAHMVFSPSRKERKDFRPAMCKSNVRCGAVLAQSGKCSPRICRRAVVPRRSGKRLSRQSCWFCHWSNTRCPRSCRKCKPWRFCWKRKCRC